jgi:hydrogenase maturation protease
MIAVIGCGNSNRCDDGVGAAVLRLLAKRPLARAAAVKLLDAGTDGMAVMFAARGVSSLIVIDACRSGSEPGAVFELPGSALDDPAPPSLTTHDFRWDHALHAGRRILAEAFPADVTVLLVEAATVDLGLALSPAVALAAARVADRIEALVDARLVVAS